MTAWVEKRKEIARFSKLRLNAELWPTSRRPSTRRASTNAARNSSKTARGMAGSRIGHLAVARPHPEIPHGFRRRIARGQNQPTSPDSRNWRFRRSEDVLRTFSDTTKHRLRCSSSTTTSDRGSMARPVSAPLHDSRTPLDDLMAVVRRVVSGVGRYERRRGTAHPTPSVAPATAPATAPGNRGYP